MELPPSDGSLSGMACSRRDACTAISGFFAWMAAASGKAHAQSPAGAVTWNLDRLDNIGGNPAHAEGAPRIIATPAGKAVEFDGLHDALFIDRHPLAGFANFTFEALVRPDGGDPAQRWFHLAETDPTTGLDSTGDPATDRNPRFTFELRVVDGDKVYFESYTHGLTYQSTLSDKTKLHAIGRWYVVTQTYDGTTHRSYVDGVLEKEGPLAFVPQGPGRSSVGVRINRTSYFKGAVMRARFVPTALAPAAFMKVPTSLNAP